MNIFELSKMVGTVLQDADGQFIGLTVGEDIAFALENDCVDQGKMKEAVQKVADMEIFSFRAVRGTEAESILRRRHG